MDDIILKLGSDLTALAVKGTVSKIDSKIKAVKLEKDSDKIKLKYEEIINEILSEREEAIRIAQLYKNEIEKYEIKDEDIKHLHNTVSIVLDIIRSLNPDKKIEGFDALKDLINVDILKSMQLLGFNYKKAIGEPLTEICAEKIKSIGKSKNNNKK